MYTLTKDDITAMKAAESFDIRADERYRTCGLHLYKEVKVRGFCGSTKVMSVSRDIGVDPAYFTVYSKTIEETRQERLAYWYECRFSCLHTESNGAWQALCKLARPGDSLQIECVSGDDTNAMKDAGISEDRCHVSLIRNGRAIVKYLLIAQYIGRAATTTRGVRVAERKEET
jgi:hypothetical protein